MPGDTKGTLRERLTTVPLFKSGGEMMTSDDLARYGARIALEMALEAAQEADACVVCGGVLLEEYPPYCEDTCRDKWHDYMDEHGDEHPGAVTRIRSLLASLDGGG